jgi:hypothetical protein
MNGMPMTTVEKVKVLRDMLLRLKGVLSDIHANDDDGSPEMKCLLDEIDDLLIKTRRQKGEPV